MTPADVDLMRPHEFDTPPWHSEKDDEGLLNFATKLR